MKTLSFNTFLCLKPCFPSEIIGIKAVLVACLHVFQNRYIHIRRENKLQEQCWDRIFHIESRVLSKNLVEFHSVKTYHERSEKLGVTKYLKIFVKKIFVETSFRKKLEHFL